MSEEIKEILEDMNLVANYNKVPIYYTQKHIKILLDYITNLQQENETLKAKLEIGKTCGFCPYYDYKSRCEKAIEYIENNKKETSSHFNGKEYVYRNFTLCCEPNDLLNILQGSDENE